MHTARILFMTLALLAGLPTAAFADDTSPITAAIADSIRPAADTDRDAERKPAETLAFAGVQPDMQVAELMPGGGYFTRLLSKVVGGEGHVYALASPPYAEAAIAIAADERYGNVTQLPLSFTDEALGLPQQVDVVWTSNNYHDLHNALDGAGIEAFNRHVFDALKSGGVYVVIDHASIAGRGASETNTLHRIDPETVKVEVLAVGFKLADSSDLLRTASDPHTAKVFDPAIRGKTDQFILKFVKP
jgi:predicted methyltransferase